MRIENLKINEDYNCFPSYLKLNAGRGIEHLEYLVHVLHQRVQVLAAVRILMFRHHLQDKGIFSCACSPPESPGTRGY